MRIPFHLIILAAVSMAGCRAPEPRLPEDPDMAAIRSAARDPQAAAEAVAILSASRALHSTLSRP